MKYFKMVYWYTYSKKAYLEIFKKKLEKSDSKEIRNIIKKILEMVE